MQWDVLVAMNAAALKTNLKQPEKRRKNDCQRGWL
jgi:hypothetical protein